MIRHIVMWKFRDFAEGGDKAANLERATALLMACRDCVPGILRFEVAPARPGFECTYDLVLYSEFADAQALAAYQAHPTHLATKPFIGAARESRQCMDYEL